MRNDQTLFSQRNLLKKLVGQQNDFLSDSTEGDYRENDDRV